MGTTTKGYTPTTGAIPTAAQWNAMVDPIYTEVNGLLDENNVAWADSDGIVTVQQTQSISGAKTFSNAAGVVVNYGLNLGGTSASASAWGLAGINLEAKAGTYTDSSTSGSATATNAAVNSFAVPTLAATNSSVTTTYASTVYIAGAPAAGTNQTLTNAYALWVDAGAVRLDGALTVTGATTYDSGDVTWNDNIKATFGTGGDADLYYDGTDVVFDPRVVGSGVLKVLNEAEVRGDAGAAGILTLSTGELTVVNGDILGRIDFQAPLESDGTDAILVGASIWAEADDTFAADLNDTDLVFAVAESETALERMRLSYDGTTVGLTFSGAVAITGGAISFGSENLVTTGTLASGVLTVTGAILPNADNGGALGASGTEFSDLFLHTGGVINWEAGDVTLTHSSNTLTVAGGTFATAAFTASTITGSGVLSVDDATDTTSGTDGSIHTDGGLGIAKALWVATTSQLVGVTTHGGNVVSDTDSTDDLGTTSVRWANLFVDDITLTTTLTAGTSLVAGTLTLAGGSITDSSAAISFGNENLSTTGTLASGALTVTGAILPNADNGGALGASGTEFSDLFLHTGGVINWEAGNVTITHTSGTLTVAGNLAATDLDGIIGSNTAAAGTFTTLAGTAFSMSAAGLGFINETANAKMTVGLTINCGAHDNEVLAFKSSDVGHAMTGLAEEDTWGAFKKSEAASGGLAISGYKDADGTNAFAVDIIGYLGEAASTTKSYLGYGIVHVNAWVTNGGTNVANPATNANLFAVAQGNSTRFIVDAEGDLHADGSAATVYDDLDDVALLSAFDRTMSQGGAKGFIAAAWEETLAENEQTLIDLDILGGPRVGVPEEERGLINYTGLARLHNSAIRQVYTKLVETMKRLALAEGKLAQLAA